jgi:hypothetical protein
MQVARKLAASVVVLAMLFASTASAYSLFRCRYDAVARTSCCCPAEEIQPPAATSISRACCCDIETIQVVRAPSTTNHSFVQPFIVTATLVDWNPLVAPRARRFASYGPEYAAHGPPLLLVKQSLLI